jgi:flavin-dependent dehydrogenase
LQSGASVVLFEAREFPRHKVCGEFVSAESLDVLNHLLRGVPKSASPLQTAPTIDRARLFLGRRVIEAPVSPAALSIARYQMDALLWEESQRAGVAAHSNCEAFTVEGEGPFGILTSDGTYTARALIVAAGRWSQFTAERTLPLGPKWIGVKAHFREPNPPPSTDLYFFEKGYCGVQPVGQGLVNACAMVRSDVATSLDEVFTLQPKLAERTAQWTAVTQPVSTAPLVYREPQPVRGNMVFTGDAAAFIDPFAGDGISIALRSGRAAAHCLSEYWRGAMPLTEAVARYRTAYTRDFAPLIAAAARVRSLLSLPGIARPAVFELLRFPGLLPYLIRKTRRAH